MLDGNKIRDWAYLLLRGQETIAERERVKGTLRRAGYPMLSGLPSNIEFVTRQEHFVKHLRNWRNVTSGELISRSF